MTEPRKTKLIAETTDKEDIVQDTIAEGHKGIPVTKAGRPEPVCGGQENDLWMGRH